MEHGIISSEYVEVLKEWRRTPETWGK